MDIHLDTLLNLPNVTVCHCYKKEDFIVLELDLLNEGINCPKCQSYTDYFNQNRPILLRDLSFCGQVVYLKVPRRQFYCRECKKYSTEPLDFLEMGRNYTIRYEEYIYDRVKTSTFEQVSRSEHLTSEQVAGIVKRMNSKKTLDKPSIR